MIRINTIASSSTGNCYLLDNGKSQLLIECGLPWAKIKQALGFRTSLLDGILVSHEHMDHGRGAKDAAKGAMNIYTSGGTAVALGLHGHRIHLLTPMVQTTIGSWVVMAIPVVHDAAEPLGFSVWSGQDHLLFLTDTAFCPYRIKGVTQLMIECNYSDELLGTNVGAGLVSANRAYRLTGSHMSLQRVSDFLQANDLSQLKEIHLMHLSDTNSCEKTFVQEIQKLTGKPVYICKR